MTENTKELIEENEQRIIGQIKIINHLDGHLFGIEFTSQINELLSKEENKDCVENLNKGVEIMHMAILNILERNGMVSDLPEDVTK